MKYEIKNLKKKIYQTDLINDLRIIANNLNKTSLLQREYCKLNGARFSIGTIRLEFGNFKNALRAAGLNAELNRHGIEFGNLISEEILLQDLQRVARDIGVEEISRENYKSLGKFGSSVIEKRFGGWLIATQKAGLNKNKFRNSSNEDLFQNILEIWTKFGRQPKYVEMIRSNSKYSVEVYTNRFGSWIKALEAFVDDVVLTP